MGNVLLTTYLSPKMSIEFDKKREDRPTALLAQRLIEYGLPKLAWCNSCNRYDEVAKGERTQSKPHREGVMNH